ncbi:MAG: cystathionine gamma-synthase [Bacteroidia bacterium]|nr:cystathionine gamma-synthase [Bacteroidia bacterium]MDW8158442.1 cystathionine gamma-synthase [Bacteroidia bacterium]
MNNLDKNNFHFDTLAVHAGIEPDPTTGAIMTPIYQTSTYVQQAPGVHKGYEYARTQNPTRDALQKAIAALEKGKYGLCFSSGMAAIDAVIKLLKPGQEVIAANDLYGGTYRIFTKIFAPWGIQFHFVDLTDPSAIDSFLNSQTRLVWIETPTNPLLKIIDIEAIVTRVTAYSPEIVTVVDNTFASPYLQNPLELGATITLHSATKYLGGHSDVVLGAIVTNTETIYEQLKFIQNSCGAVPGPMDCFLVLRGLKTLHLRMQRHCENAYKIAHFLEQHPKVAKVYYPGLISHPNHIIAAKQMNHYGGMVSFYTHGNTIEESLTILKNTKLFSLAESLGGVESLIGHPATMTHASIPEEERKKAGLENSLIRLSVGIENADDLIQDLNQALDKI